MRKLFSVGNGGDSEDSSEVIGVSQEEMETSFNLIFPIRFAMLKTGRPCLYRELLGLESHVQERLKKVS